MKPHSVLCALLMLTMILSFSACYKTPGEENEEESNVPAETVVEDSTIQPEETPDEVSDAVSISSDPPEDRSDLVIFNWAEYVNRPHEIQEGTVLNYARYDVPSQLPWNCVSEGWLTGNIYEGLLYMYMNDPTDIRGCIAESWIHSEDYLTWTFRIRDGAKFHDGTVCDAAAVSNAWDFIQKVTPAVMTNYNIASWEAANDREFVVHLSAPCAHFEVVLSGYALFVVSPTALALYGINDNRAAVGTGPYYIDSYTSCESIVLKANLDYYLKEKMPCIETVNFQFYKGQDAIVDALLDGETDGANIVSSFVGNAYRDGPGSCVTDYKNLKKDYDGNLVVCFDSAQPLWLNTKKVKLFRTVEVREAICRFIDFEVINDALYDGLGCVQDSLWSKGTSGYVPTDQFYYDPDEGRSLLASVGMDVADINFENTIGPYGNILVSIGNELAKSGIRMENVPQDPKSSFTIYHGDGSWAIMPFGIGSGTAPYLPWMYILKPDALFKLCWQDIYDPDLYEKMLDEYDSLIKTTIWDDMLTHCKQLTTYVQDDFGAIGGIQPPAFIALSKDINNGVYFSEQHHIQLYYLYLE